MLCPLLGSRSWFRMQVYEHLGRESRAVTDNVHLPCLGFLFFWYLVNALGLFEWGHSQWSWKQDRPPVLMWMWHHLPCGVSLMKANMCANCCLFYYVSWNREISKDINYSEFLLIKKRVVDIGIIQLSWVKAFICTICGRLLNKKIVYTR